MARCMFEDIITDLYDFLDSHGFLDFEKDGYMEINKNGESLNEAVFDFLEKNPERKNYEFSISSESPGLDDTNATVIISSYYDNENLTISIDSNKEMLLVKCYAKTL